MDFDEKQDNSYNRDEISLSCRVCLIAFPENLIPLSEIFIPGETRKTIIEAILYCTGVLVSCEDPFPQFCCKRCLAELEVSYKLKRICVESDSLLKNDALLREKIDKFAISGGAVVVDPGNPAKVLEQNDNDNPAQFSILEGVEDVQQNRENEGNLNAPENFENEVPENPGSILKSIIKPETEIFGSVVDVENEADPSPQDRDQENCEVVSLLSASSSLSIYPSYSDDERQITKKKRRQMSQEKDNEEDSSTDSEQDQEQKFDCSKCSASFYFREEYDIHLKFAHKNDPVELEEVRQNIVKTVENEIPTRKERSSPIQTNPKRRSTDDNSSLASDPKSKKKKSDSDYEPTPPRRLFKCKDCSQEFTYQSSLSTHKKKFHARATVKCKLCKKIYINSHTYENHKCKVVQALLALPLSR